MTKFRDILLVILIYELTILLILFWIICIFPSTRAPEKLIDRPAFDLLEPGKVSLNKGNTPESIFSRGDSFRFTKDREPVILEASWYSEEYCLGCRKDLLTASGVKFDSQRFYCASNDYPFGTILWLKYRDKITYCKVVDRMGEYYDLDLALSVFQKLENPNVGWIKVEIIN